MSPSPRKLGTLPAPVIDVVRFELSNGARLLVSPRPGAPMTAAQVHLRGGHSLDPDGLDGVAWLTGRLVDQGTAGRTAEQLVDELDPLGGSVQGDSSGVSGSIISRHWRVLCKRVAELVVSPRYPKARFELQRGRVLDRLLLERDDPRSRAMHGFRSLVYGEHWLGRPHYGSLESIERIERRHVVAFHRKNWVAARAVIAVCGDVDPEAVRRLFERELSALPRGKELGPPDQTFPARAPRVAAFQANRQQVHLYLGHLGVRIQDPDYAALVVMDHVLGTGPGFTDRISRRLRDEDGLAYTVHANIHSSAGNLPGTFTAYIGTSPEHTDRAVAGFLEEMRRIQDEPVGAAELDVAKNYLTGSFGLGFERASRRVGFLVSQLRFGLPDDHLTSLPARFAAVTAADVQAAAQRHLFPEAACLVGGGPLSKRELGRALAGLRAVSERDEARAAALAFDVPGQLVGLEPLVRGHINRTWISTWEHAGERQRLLHQRINEHVFRDVAGLMHNVEAVTRRLAEVQAGSPYEALRLVWTRTGEHWLRAADGPWRTYHFVEGTEAFDRCSGPSQAFEVARIFGWFQHGLEALDSGTLVETIPGFFSPGLRLRQFQAALAGVDAVSAASGRDRVGGFEGCREALEFVAARVGLVERFEAHLASGRFPARVVHGDTKLNNVLFDVESGAARAVVDLDTAMPGFLLYDFGDMVRFTAATSAEDERDLSLAGTDLEVYRALRDGYLECAADSLTDLERELLPEAGPLVTLVIGLRFLTDHLAGDVYFGASREGHNLDRARVQFAQVACMEAFGDELLG